MATRAFPALTAGWLGLTGLLATSAPPATAAAPLAAAAKASSCPPSLKRAFARDAGVADVSVRANPAFELATCHYRASKARPGHCGAATIQVNTAPQPYRDFQRWLVEIGQTAAQSSVHAPGHSPVQVNGVGLEADWVPAPRIFSTATEKRWVTVTLNCQVSPARGQVLARRLAVAALTA